MKIIKLKEHPNNYQNMDEESLPSDTQIVSTPLCGKLLSAIGQQKYPKLNIGSFKDTDGRSA
jgi:hypothetical protein